MFNVTLTTILFVLSSQTVLAANNSVNKKSCSKVDKKIAVIHNKMRSGYSAKQGNLLNEKLRELKNLRDKCKKKKHVTSDR